MNETTGIIPGLTLHVSVEGNDRASGRSVSDAFATLERARDELRAVRRSAGLPKGGAVVELAGGVYFRDSTFLLAPEDSGTADAPIVYRGRSGESVRICGGKRVDGFVPVTDKEVLSRLDPTVHGRVLEADLGALGICDYGDVSGGGLELFFDHRAMTLARWPNDDFVRITGLVGGDPVDVRGTKGDRIGKFMYDGDRPKRWSAEKDLWVHGYWFWDWSDQRHPVESIDVDRRIISVKPPFHTYGYRIGQWFYALNALSEIDSPGEWYLDRDTGILYFYPPAPIDSAETIVSVIPTAIEMVEVSHVTIEGVTIETTRKTGITITGGEGVRVRRCVLRNLGSGVAVSGGTGHGVESCDIYGMANGAIALAGGDRSTLTPAEHFATNNDIYEYGRWNRMYQAGIAMNGVGIRAANNRIHDAPHMAIVFSGNDHLIEYNEIYRVCHESNDAGAIYAGRDWTMRGTVIRHNYLHDIQGFEEKACVGVYLDDMFCGTAMYGNLFYRVRMATFVGGGRDCAIENNIFVDCVPSVHIDNRAMNWASYHVDTTMTDRLKQMPYLDDLWRSRYRELVGILDDEPAAPKGNRVMRNISVGGEWDGIRAGAKPFVTVEANLIDEDPRFVATPPGSFELREDSPAWKLGFQRIPVERIGLKR